jgi:hypothetical protein
MREYVYDYDGVYPIIYTNAWRVNSYLANWTTADLLDHLYWLAQYRGFPFQNVEHAGPPTLPTRVPGERVILHQTCDKKPGFPGEVQSLSVCWDRWCLGIEAQMWSWMAQEWGLDLRHPWFTEIDLWARNMGFNGPQPPEMD